MIPSPNLLVELSAWLRQLDLSVRSLDSPDVLDVGPSGARVVASLFAGRIPLLFPGNALLSASYDKK